MTYHILHKSHKVLSPTCNICRNKFSTTRVTHTGNKAQINYTAHTNPTFVNRKVELLYLRTFAPGNKSSTIELSFFGTVVPRNFHSWELSFPKNFVLNIKISTVRSLKLIIRPILYTIFDALTADIVRFINVFRPTYLLYYSC